MNKLILLTILSLFGNTLGTTINKEIICFNDINTKDLDYNFVIGNISCPNYIIKVERINDSSRNNNITIFHNNHYITDINNYFEYVSPVECDNSFISLKLLYQCENIKKYKEESRDNLNIYFYNKKALVNINTINVNKNNDINNFRIKNSNLLNNYQNLINHIYYYKTYYITLFIISVIVLI